MSEWSYIGVYVHHCVVVAHSWHRFDSVDEGGSVAKEQVQDVRPSTSCDKLISSHMFR